MEPSVEAKDVAEVTNVDAAAAGSDHAPMIDLTADPSPTKDRCHKEPLSARPKRKASCPERGAATAFAQEVVVGGVYKGSSVGGAGEHKSGMNATGSRAPAPLEDPWWSDSDDGYNQGHQHIEAQAVFASQEAAGALGSNPSAAAVVQKCIERRTSNKCEIPHKLQRCAVHVAMGEEPPGPGHVTARIADLES